MAKENKIICPNCGSWMVVGEGLLRQVERVGCVVEVCWRCYVNNGIGLLGKVST